MASVLLQRLNMDNSWFLEFSGTRLLIDPWLEGEEVDYVRWLNVQWHRTDPIAYDLVPEFDLVLITQKYPDHYHEPTLLKLQPKVVCAPASLGRRLSRLLPEATLYLFDKEARHHQVGNLSLTHLPTRRRIDPIYDAYTLEAEGEVVMVANHGMSLDADHQAQLQSVGPCDVLMSPFNSYALPALLGGIVAPGIEGLRALMDVTQPRTVVQTHDEPKHGTGLVPMLAKVERFEPAMAESHPWLKPRFLDISDYTPVSP
jgi:L-ascorbate metabolism protein UlaG (beta-lactamase superfamily)